MSPDHRRLVSHLLQPGGHLVVPFNQGLPGRPMVRPVEVGIIGATAMVLSPGTHLGPYEIVSLLGTGGMGEVYRARDSRLERFVAIKVLSPRVAATPEALARFQREARAVAALNHPHICTIHDVGAGEAGNPPYIAMELVEGETLHRRVQRGPVAIAEVVEIGIALADALETAHAHGIVHRDIKPANIVLTARGPKMLDFGLARPATTDVPAASYELTRQGDAPLTDPGATVGTLAYMSPEQLRGEPIDGRSDLFSLGLVLYELATGRPAFGGATSAMVSAATLHEAPRAPRTLRPELPARLEDTILKALEKDRTLRCQSASELRADLRRIAREPESSSPRAAESRPPVPALDPPPVPAESAASPASSDAAIAASLIGRNRGLVLAAAIVFVAVVAGAVMLWQRSGVPAAVPADTAASAVVPASGQKSIAVLPFTDVSPDRDQEYFADGISDELSTVLSRVPGLQVTGRTSAFFFKGRSDDLRSIGEQLGVDYLLTGSVRKAGSQVRITPALVNAATGYQLWSTNYDRPLDDIFDVQDEIARAVAGALEITLGVGVGSVPGMTRNVAAYEEYLRGLALLVQYRPERFPAAAEHAERALALDPSFSYASVLLASIYRQGAAMTTVPGRAAEWTRRSVDAIEQARARAPDSLPVRYAVALEELRRGNWLDAGALLHAEGARPPSAPMGRFLFATGRVQEARRFLESARAADPLDPSVALFLGEAQAAVGDFTAAFAEWDRGLRLGGLEPIFRGAGVVAALAQGDPEEIGRRARMASVGAIGTTFDAERLRGLSSAAAPAELRRLAGTPDGESYVGRTLLAFWSAYHGHPELAFEYLEPIAGTYVDESLLWRPVFRDVRALPAFKDLVRRHGYVEYWRTYGWGDFCRPTTGDDFTCG